MLRRTTDVTDAAEAAEMVAVAEIAVKAEEDAVTTVRDARREAMNNVIT